MAVEKKTAPGAVTLGAGSAKTEGINTEIIPQETKPVKSLFNVYLVDNPNWDGVAVFMPDTQTWNLCTLEETAKQNISRMTAELMRRKEMGERVAV